MSTQTSFDPTFDAYAREVNAIAACVGEIAPVLKQHPAVLPVFVKCAILLVVLRLESCLTSLLVPAVQIRETTARGYFRDHGTKEERALAPSCDHHRIIQMIRRRVSFQEGGSDLDRLFQLLLGFDLWPDWRLRYNVTDLMLVRNVLVHEQERVLPEQVRLAYRGDLFLSKTDGQSTAYEVDYPQVLTLVQDVLAGLAPHVGYLRGELLKRAERTSPWTT